MSRTTHIPYEPETWSENQRALHTPFDLDEALHSACCLAGGWYRRPVRIDSKVVAVFEMPMDGKMTISSAGWGNGQTARLQPDSTLAGSAHGSPIRIARGMPTMKGVADHQHR